MIFGKSVIYSKQWGQNYEQNKDDYTNLIVTKELETQIKSHIKHICVEHFRLIKLGMML